MTTTINASTSAGLVQTADTSGSLALQTASTTALTLDTSQNATFAGSVKTNTLTSAASTALTLQSAGTTAVTIDTSQNVGIGTSNNNVFDQVGGARPLLVQKSDTSTTIAGSLASITISNGDTTTNNTAQINFATITGASTNQYSGATISAVFGARTNGQYPSGQLVFSTSTATNAAPTEKMRINSSGYVGIGTTAPETKVQIEGTADTVGATLRITSTGVCSAGMAVNATGLFFATDTGGFVWKTGTQNLPTTGGTERMRLDSSGSFMIGTTSPGGKLTVAGSDSSSSNNALYVKNSNSNALFYVRDDGWLNLGNASLSPYNNTTGNGANMYIATDSSVQRSTSSLKYKTDVVDARFGLADVLKLRAVNYKSKNPSDGDKVFGGLIAEEVEEAGLTEFVIHAQDGTPDALNYSNMVSLAFKAIQEQQALITAQAETINALTARIVALEGA